MGSLGHSFIDSISDVLGLMFSKLPEILSDLMIICLLAAIDSSVHELLQGSHSPLEVLMILCWHACQELRNV